jgi:hypothetical protein
MTVATEAPAAGSARARYEQGVLRCERMRVPVARRSVLISRLRLSTFLAGVACAIWAGSRGPALPLIVAAALLFACFAGLVVWHARVEERLALIDALRLVNERGTARVGRDWARLPAADVPAGLSIDGHPYAADLDVFGRASLFQWIGPAATPIGARRLGEWLLTPATPDEIGMRQTAVAALAPLDDWREQLAALGVLSSAVRQLQVDRFLEWVEGPPLAGGREPLLRAAALVLTIALWVLLLLYWRGVIGGGPGFTLLILGLILSFALGKTVQECLDRAGGGQQALSRYAGILAHAVTAPRTDGRLSELHDRLTASGERAPDEMRRFNRILSFGELRRGAAILHAPIQALTLWDFHVVLALERWRRKTGPAVRHWLEAAGELDALSLLAGVRRDNPDWCVPAIAREPLFEADGLAHPLLEPSRRVSNDVRIGPPGTLLLVTGSNMSGKSTLLRSIGLNIVLAQAGSVVAATRLSLPPSDLETSLRVQDSLELGLSYFMAALARLKGVVDAAQHERPGRVLFYLLDEILQGTNSVERAIAVRAITRHLLDAGAIGAMTTHDLGLATEEPLAQAAQLMHFTEIVDPDGHMRFDYRLRPGIATSRNAIRLMKMIGIEP